MNRKKQLDHWKALYEEIGKREEEIGKVLTGERIYIFETLEIIERAIKDLYELDDSEWNDDLIFRYVYGSINYETFKSFIVEKGGSYEGLNCVNGRYWKEPYIIVDNDQIEKESV